jgi:hypothetical protein
MVIRRGLSVCVILTLIMLVSGPLFAQVSGATLTGTVADASGAQIPGAKVSIKNTATGVTREVATDSAGFYSAPNILPGNYKVTISSLGFSTVVESKVLLEVGMQRVLNPVMKVGQASETVDVSAAAMTVQLSSSALGGEVDSTTVRELPLNGRDWTSLATLQAGIVGVRTQTSAGAATSPRGNRGYGSEVSDSGHRPNENNYRINGISVVDYANGSPGDAIGVTLGVDSIAEFSILTSNYSAEYGRTSGGVIDAITRSGTNAIHGDAYYFLRNQALDAKNPFDPAIPPFHRNQFGASGGGPILKEKTFLFLNYEGIRQSKSLTFSDLVPSADARKGILHNADGTTTVFAVDPKVAPFLGFYPLPQTLLSSGNTGRWNGSGLATFSENYFSARGDHHISEKDSLALGWFYDQGPYAQPDVMNNVIHEAATQRQMGSIEETHIFSPALVNTTRVGFNRAISVGGRPVSAINPLASDTSLAAIPGHYAPILAVSGLTQMGGALNDPSGSTYTWNSFQFYDDAFLTRGVHTIKFGFSAEAMQFDEISRIQSNGLFTFNSLSDFLHNLPQKISLLEPGAGKEVGNRQKAFGAYLQDDWHIRQNLTLNVGIRYEPATNPTEAHNQFQIIRDFYNGGAVPVHNVFVTNPTLRNFAPRVGFAWDPFHNGKTAIRAGVGVFDTLPLAWLWGFQMGSSYPFSLFLNQSTSAAVPLAGTFPDQTLAKVGGFQLSKAQQRYVQPSPPRSYSVNWNLNVQQEITPNLTATIGYVGSRSLHQAVTPDNMNMALPTLTSAGYLWPYPVGSVPMFNPNTTDIRATVWDGGGYYSGLLAQVTKKMFHNFQVQGSFTWGKCFDNGSSGAVGDPYQNSITSLISFDRASRHGLCDFNIAKNFVLNYLWEVPKPSWGGTFAHRALGGWEVGGIVTASTGSPFTVLMSGDPAGMQGDPWPFPNRLHGAGCDGNPVNPGNLTNYVKVQCFSVPIAPPALLSKCQPGYSGAKDANGNLIPIPNSCMNLGGNSGRNTLIGPGLFNADLSVFKNTSIRKISDSFKVQYRVEFFNVLNHANYQAPVNNLALFTQTGAPIDGAGAIDATSAEMRQIQFGVKAIW